MPSPDACSAEAGTLRSERLPPGRYRLKLYVDRQGKLAKDPTASLGDADFVGQVDVESQWPAGYARMTTVRFPDR